MQDETAITNPQRADKIGIFLGADMIARHSRQ
jgi:hypothetical protein